MNKSAVMELREMEMVLEVHQHAVDMHQQMMGQQ